MNIEEVKEYLHGVFGGSEKYSNVVDVILSDSVIDNDSMRKAYSYLDFSMNNKDNCKGEEEYWCYAKQVCLAKVLIAILLHLRTGKTEFLELPDVKTLMTSLRYLEEWAHQLASSHEHKYVLITLKQGDKNEDYLEGCPFAIRYERCMLCGDRKYQWDPPNINDIVW